jgi:hypothetical protein
LPCPCLHDSCRSAHDWGRHCLARQTWFFSGSVQVPHLEVTQAVSTFKAGTIYRTTLLIRPAPGVQGRFAVNDVLVAPIPYSIIIGMPLLSQLAAVIDIDQRSLAIKLNNVTYVLPLDITTPGQPHLLPLSAAPFSLPPLPAISTVAAVPAPVGAGTGGGFSSASAASPSAGSFSPSAYSASCADTADSKHLARQLEALRVSHRVCVNDLNKKNDDLTKELAAMKVAVLSELKELRSATIYNNYLLDGMAKPLDLDMQTLKLRRPSSCPGPGAQTGLGLSQKP